MRPTARRRARSAAVLVAVLLGLVALALTPARAEAAAVPAGHAAVGPRAETAVAPAAAGAPAAARAAAAAATSTPAPTTLLDPASAAESVLIWVRDASTKAGVPGARAAVTGPHGFQAAVTTGADGRVEVGLPDPGTYHVRLDTTSLPAGLTVPSASGAERDVDASRGNKQVPAFYLLVAGTGPQTAPPTHQATATPTTKATSTAAPGALGSSSDSGASLGDRVWPRVASGLIFGLLLALASIGVSLIYGTTGLSNFAHGELVSFGGLITFTFAAGLAVPGPLAIVVATILGGAFGWVQDAGLWRPLRRRRLALVPLMIVSIGLSLALRYTFQVIWGPGAIVLPQDNSAALSLGAVNLRSSDLISAGLCVVVLVAVALLLLMSRIGKATRAVSDNRALAAASGIDVERVIRIVWTAGGALAALAGSLLAYYQTVRWDSGASILLLIFAAVTLGGFGTAFGALIGSIIIGLFIDLSTLVLPANMKFVAALVALIVILLVRPQGLLGRRDRVG